MPNPSGCFVLVASGHGLSGDREYLNGPAQLRVLTALPFDRNWRRRIRSISVGPNASATVWTAEQLTGRQLPLRSDTVYDALPSEFDGTVQSLTIRCTLPAP
jgi:hypothetical protein